MRSGKLAAVVENETPPSHPRGSLSFVHFYQLGARLVGISLFNYCIPEASIEVFDQCNADRQTSSQLLMVLLPPGDTKMRISQFHYLLNSICSLSAFDLCYYVVFLGLAMFLARVVASMIFRFWWHHSFVRRAAETAIVCSFALFWLPQFNPFLYDQLPAFLHGKHITDGLLIQGERLIRLEYLAWLLQAFPLYVILPSIVVAFAGYASARGKRPLGIAGSAAQAALLAEPTTTSTTFALNQIIPNCNRVSMVAQSSVTRSSARNQQAAVQLFRSDDQPAT